LAIGEFDSVLGWKCAIAIAMCRSVFGQTEHALKQGFPDDFAPDPSYAIRLLWLRPIPSLNVFPEEEGHEN